MKFLIRWNYGSADYFEVLDYGMLIVEKCGLKVFVMKDNEMLLINRKKKI